MSSEFPDKYDVQRYFVIISSNFKAILIIAVDLAS